MKLARRLSLLLVLLPLVYLLGTFAQVWSASRQDGRRPAGAIVVLGAAQYGGEPSPVLRARLDHAAALYTDGVAPLVVVTGGRIDDADRTEASVSLGYLIGEGVPEDDVRLEVEGRSSFQSLQAAARILDDEGVDDVVLVSSPYHALRTEHIAGEVGLSGTASPTRTSPEGASASLSQLGRETVAVSIGRLIGYRRLG